MVSVISLLLVCVCSFGRADAGSGTDVCVQTEGAHIREGPGIGFPVIKEMEKGSCYPIVSKEKDWVELSLGSGMTGWAAAWLVSGKVQTESGIIRGSGVTIRSGPGTGYESAGLANNGDEVRILERSGQWIQIQKDEVEGWVYDPYLEQAEPSAQGKITADRLAVRASASPEAKQTGTVTKGSVCRLLAEKNHMLQIETINGITGWVPAWYVERNEVQIDKQELPDGTWITILYQGTSLRTAPDPLADTAELPPKGKKYKALRLVNGWYEVELAGGEKAFAAGWVVRSGQKVLPDENRSLQQKIIVLDPGHGGKDQGAEGAGGTLEKDLTLKTAKLVKDQLERDGAKVILTREDDRYVELSSRVRTAHTFAADAYISFHYDSTLNTDAEGITAYSYHSYQKPLADSLQQELSRSFQVTSRGSLSGDYYVLRENRRMAALIELGYLSNPSEEQTITSTAYQKSVAEAVYHALTACFAKSGEDF